MQKIDWIFELKQKVPQFLEKLKGKKIPGFFHYSLSSDLYDEKLNWGLANTTFATKIYATLNLLEGLSMKNKQTMIDFIKGFQNQNGTISDPLIRKLAWKKNLLLTLKIKNLNNVFGQETMRAETRQAISSLKIFNTKPDFPFQKFPQTKKDIEKYLNKLNWQRPWHSGSQFSHLLFFLENSDLQNKTELTSEAIQWINTLQNPKDGCWYQGNPSPQERVNGAMKIITGLQVTGHLNFKYPEKIIDLCLGFNQYQQACDHFNLIYVLYHSCRLAQEAYRIAEIKQFAKQKLRIYYHYYYPEIGGFSFWPHRANMYYYGAKITKGLDEPDIHGTCMFLQGINLTAQILKINSTLQFQEVVL